MRLFKRSERWAALLLVALLSAFLPAPAAAAPDNQGSEFIVGFLENYYAGSGGNTTIFLTGPNATTATVAAPGIGFGPTTVAITPGTITSVSIPTSIRADGSGTKESKGIRITSPQEVTLYGLNQVTYTTDAFLGLPTDILGKEYLVGAFRNRSSGYVSELMVVGTVDGTQVTMKPTATTDGGTHVPSTPAGTPVTFTLNRLQTIQFTAAGGTGPDLTGSEILSTQPVAVFGGHVCADVPGLGTPWCDHLVEQMPPVSTWGNSFLTVPLATRTAGDLFRIVAANNGTTVSIDGALVATINRGQFYEVSIPSNAYRQITTSGPALVLQYSKGSSADNVTSDPFMMMIPPTAQFASDYTVSTPPASPVAFNNFINIAAPTADLAGLRLDGAPISAPFTPIGSSGFSGARVPVSIGAHTVKHISPIVPFGVYVYGFASYDSYGYPGGLRLAPIAQPCIPTPTVPADGLDNDCDGKIDEELGNGVDDDGDGAVDEDLATPPANQPPTANADGPYTVPEGGSVTLMGSGSDPDGDPLAYAWDLDNNGTFETPGQNPTFSAAGRDGPSSQTVVLKVCDNKGACATSSATVNVTNVAPTVTAGPDATIDEGSAFASSGSFTDPGADTWTATVNYGDGSGTQALALNPDKTFALSHVYADNGVYTVTVTVVDDDGGIGSDTAVVTVKNVAPTVTAGPDATVYSSQSHTVNATFTDPGLPDTHTATINWGDGSPVQGVPVVQGSGSGSLSASHQYFVPGTYIITVCVKDDDGGQGCDDLSLQVKRLPVQIDIKPGSDPNSINLGSKGNVPVGVFTGTYHAVALDATSIVRSSLLFAGAPDLGTGKTPQDLDGDGDLDMVFHFDTEIVSLSLTSSSTQACLTGQTTNNLYFEGCDSVRIVPPKK